MSVPDPTTGHLNILRKYFGHNQFRPMQWKIIHSLLEKKQDNCVVMATGYGKSLCYQYPAVYTGGLSIVISPLISLMQDQVLSLQMSNIPACYFGSGQSRTKSFEDVINGLCRVLYVTPEWCTADDNCNLLAQINESVKVTLIAIDEAHCVSQWGHDFRPSYRKLGMLRKIISNVPILAVTATATTQVRIDICRSLNLRNAQVTCTTFDRPNLYLSVSMKGNDIFADIERLLVKGTRFTYRFPGPTIIYCPTKKQTEKVAEELNAHGIKCSPYHADLPYRTRQTVHEQFVKDQLQVVVATVAFGMGIDKPDVRCVVHYGAPKEFESYYQEVGRAGRDGLPSTCHVFYSTADFSLQKYFMNTGSTDSKFRQHREKMVRQMQQYLETRGCRREMLLAYFNDINVNKPKTTTSNCCDNCTKLIQTGKSAYGPQVDVVDDVKHLLKVIEIFNGRFGLTVPVKFLRGMNDAKIPKQLLNHELYGSGRIHSEAAWKALGRLCVREELLKEVSCNSGFSAKKFSFPMSTIAITDSGKNFIKMGEDCGVKLAPSLEVETLFKKKQTLPIETENKKTASSKLEQYKNSRTINKEKEQQAALFAAMKRLRDQLAQEFNCSLHMVATDLALHHIAIRKPLTLSDLANIDGFTEAKIEKFGQQILQKVKEVCNPKDNSAPSDTQFPDDELFDMMSDDMLANMPDYSSANVCYNEYQFDESELAEIDSSKPDPVPEDPPKVPDQDYWGTISDELFDSVPLDDLEQSAKAPEPVASKPAPVVQTTKPQTDKKPTVKPQRIQYDTDSEDDQDTSILNDKNFSALTVPPTPTVQDNVAKKRVLPAWLTQPAAKEEIKRRINGNSLFKI